MTDKEIIIDGVDVSGCKAYSKYREGYCDWYTPCKGDSCSYKLDWALDQLKRKTQEREKLKEKYLNLKEQNGSFIVQLNTVNERLDQLKAENNELKKELDLYKTWYRAKHVDIINLLGSYRKALEEIEQFCVELSDYDLAEETVNLILEIINKNKAKDGEQCLKELGKC